MTNHPLAPDLEHGLVFIRKRYHRSRDGYVKVVRDATYDECGEEMVDPGVYEPATKDDAVRVIRWTPREVEGMDEDEMVDLLLRQCNPTDGVRLAKINARTAAITYLHAWELFIAREQLGLVNE